MKVDPLHRGIEWQLVNILVICKIHFKRSIEQLVRERWQENSAGRHMMALLSCRSRDAYYQILYYVFHGE